MSKKLFPQSVTQNPSSLKEQGQEYQVQVREQVELILKQFLAVLPSNYVSQTTAPFYTVQFQAMAEAVARLQLGLQESLKDSLYEFTRSEFLWQMLGVMVFPKVYHNKMQIPLIDKDTDYRDFLRAMIVLLLKGTKHAPIQEGTNLLTDATVTLIEKALTANQEGSAWGYDDLYTFEVNVEKDGGTSFPDRPFDLEYNISVILDALKPAYTIYEYRHVFRETFGHIFQDEMFANLDMYEYDDLRKYCGGAKRIHGEGEVLSGRFLLSDSDRFFGNIGIPAYLIVEDKRYEVSEILSFPMGDDPTPRHYTTSSGLEGYATIEGDTLTDKCQNWVLAKEGEKITFHEGANTGVYRLKDVLGSDGGSVGFVTGSSTQVRVGKSIVRTTTRLPVGVSFSYELSVDRLGVQIERTSTQENLTLQCVL